MSIRIGGANLIKRYINGQSIKKVMYNGQQIWGEGIIPPPVDYHIIGDFQGGMPSGWTSTGGTVSGGGLRDGGARWNQMPDLTNAIRIKIVYNIDVDGDSELSGEIKRGDNTYYGTTMGNDGGLTQNLHSLFFPYENTSETFTSFPAGTYIITADMDLLALTAIQELECPPLGHVENSEISITQEDVNLIRTGKVFDIFANASTVVHKIDFYVWYGHSEQQWIPEGYAMPTASAYEELTNKLNELNVPQYDWYKMLHMPLVGYGSRDSTDRVGFGTSTFMRTLSPSTGGGSTSWHITTGSANMFRNDGRGYGQPVRAFKDQYIAPDNTWTIEWGNLGGAGIFWNQRLGLISITDGNDFNLTMSDKNLGATIAWSYGDELVDANCGLYYQWGNCYGFSFTGGFTTDTQCVDTTGYGYGNYYSRAVYVFGTDWSCSPNDALWDPNPYVPVTGLIFQEAGQTITLQPGQTYQLHASVTPSNASNQRILYSQGAGALYFSISPTGLISIPSGSTGGSTTIDVNTVEGGFSSSCNLVIDVPYVPVAGIGINLSEDRVAQGGYCSAEVIISPANATQEVYLSSTAAGITFTFLEEIISGNQKYRYYRVSVGQDVPIGSNVTITATPSGGSVSSYDTFTVISPTILISSIAINTGASSSGYISQGGSATPFLVARPGNATNKDISFTADNPGVTLTYMYRSGNPSEFCDTYSLSVDRNVPVDTVVTLTAVSADGNATATGTFTVSAFVPVTGIGVLGDGKTLRITNNNGNINYPSIYPRVCPYDASIQSTTASSSNPNISITKAGGEYYNISGGNIGDTAHIEFTSDDGNYTAGFDVEIIAGTPVTGLSFTEDNQAIALRPGETYQLNAHVEPVEAANQTIDYYPFGGDRCDSTPNFFAVSSTGLITMSQNAHDGARGNLILKTNDGGMEGQCVVYCTEYYTVAWKNHDGTVLETDQVFRGDIPVYSGATPDYYNGEPSIEDYVFNGWSPTPGPIYSHTTYWATYRSLNGDGPDIEPI